jgi:hypothetical protein
VRKQKRAVSGVKQHQDLGSREYDKDKENYDEEDECRSDHDGETQPNTTSRLAQSLREDAARSCPQPNPLRSNTVHQQSVQLGDGDVVRSHPPPKPTGGVNVPHQQPIWCSDTAAQHPPPSRTLSHDFRSRYLW